MQFHFALVCFPSSLDGGTIASVFDFLFSGCNPGRTFFHLLKNGSRLTTRSLMTGRLGSGSTIITSALSVATRVWHASRGCQLIAIAHVPHMPTRHEQRNATDESCWRWMS